MHLNLINFIYINYCLLLKISLYFCFYITYLHASGRKRTELYKSSTKSLQDMVSQKWLNMNNINNLYFITYILTSI